MTHKQIELLLLAGYACAYKRMLQYDWDADRDLEILREINKGMKEKMEIKLPTLKSPSVETFSA